LRSAAITTANKWFPDHPVINNEIEFFALQSLKQLSQEVLHPTYDYYHHSETSDVSKDEIEEERKWTQIDIERHLDLFLLWDNYSSIHILLLLLLLFYLDLTNINFQRLVSILFKR
jgi:hypothetical protein